MFNDSNNEECFYIEFCSVIHFYEQNMFPPLTFIAYLWQNIFPPSNLLLIQLYG